MVALLKQSIPPKGYEYLVEIFFSIRKAEPIRWSDIAAYAQLMKREFSVFEVQALTAMDNVVTDYIHKQSE